MRAPAIAAQGLLNFWSFSRHFVLVMITLSTGTLIVTEPRTA
jgi:hypothetical protein